MMNDNKHPEQDPAEGRGKPSRGIQSGRSRWVRIKIKSREARMSRALKPPNRRQNNPLKRGPAKGSEVTKAATEVLILASLLRSNQWKHGPSLPAGHGWQYEPKWDDFRCLAFKHGSNVDGRNWGRPFPGTSRRRSDICLGFRSKVL